MGGDAGGSEAAFSSMTSDRASGIRRGHSTKVVARLSFGRAAPTRAQLIPFVSRCYGSIPAWAMRGQFDVLMAQGKRAATWLATIDGRQGRARILSEASAYPRTRALGLRRAVQLGNGAAWRGNKATAPVASWREQIDICSPRRR